MNPQRTMPLGARLGIWLGVFGWLIGFGLVTLPATATFAGPLAGGAALAALQAIVVCRTAARAPRYFPGVLCLTMALTGAYWMTVLEPAVQARPEVVDLLARRGAQAHFPPPMAFAAALAGLTLLGGARLTSRGR